MNALSSKCARQARERSCRDLEAALGADLAELRAVLPERRERAVVGQVPRAGFWKVQKENVSPERQEVFSIGTGEFPNRQWCC